MRSMRRPTRSCILKHNFPDSHNFKDKQSVQSLHIHQQWPRHDWILDIEVEERSNKNMNISTILGTLP